MTLKDMEKSLRLLSAFKVKLDDLRYTDGIAGLQKASSKQRGFIHGLCKKLNMDESDLGLEVSDMTISEASKIIEDLKFMSDGNSGFANFEVLSDYDYLPF